MTVVAVDTAYEMATESGVWDRGRVASMPKLRDLGGGRYAAGCGEAAAVQACLDWLQAGAVPEDWPAPCTKENWGEVLTLDKDNAQLFSYCTLSPHRIQMFPPVAIGDSSAAGAVLALMTCINLGAANAIQMATECGYFDSLRLPVQTSR